MPPACERRFVIGFYLRKRREKQDVYGSRQYPGLWRSHSVDVQDGKNINIRLSCAFG